MTSVMRTTRELKGREMRRGMRRGQKDMMERSSKRREDRWKVGSNKQTSGILSAGKILAKTYFYTQDHANSGHATWEIIEKPFGTNFKYKTTVLMTAQKQHNNMIYTPSLK